MRRVLRTLRSPRLALGLVLFMAAYGFIGTLFPQHSAGPAEVGAFALRHPAVAAVAGPLGLFSAFTSPVFLLAVAVLLASLTACALHRTSVLRRSLTGPAVPGRVRDALERRPRVVIGPLSVPEDALRLSGEALAAEGYRSIVEDGVLAASRRPWAAFGSPLFHWSLAALVLFVAAGQLTRAEGHLPVPIDGRTVDAAPGYVSVDRAPLFPGFTGLEFGARDFLARTVVDGLDRGPSAVVTIYGPRGPLAEERVYPNSPLRHGPLLVHPDTWGYAPLLSLETTSGDTVAQVRGFIPVSATTSDGVGPATVDFSGRVLGRATIRFSIPAEGIGPDGFPVLSRSLRYSVKRNGGPPTAAALLGEGERVPFADGLWLRFAQRGRSVRVIVTNDWSVPYIYALFGLAFLGLAVTLVLPPSRVWMMTAERDGSRYLHVVVSGSGTGLRADGRVTEMLNAVAETSAKAS